MDEVLNKELNETISELFHKMIKASDKIVSTSEGLIRYDNGLAIKVATKRMIENNKAFSFKETCSPGLFIVFWETNINPDVDKVVFYIKTPYKAYVVPEFTSRTEYAEVLDTLDESLKQFEQRKLSEYLNHFDNYEFQEEEQLE